MSVKDVNAIPIGIGCAFVTSQIPRHMWNKGVAVEWGGSGQRRAVYGAPFCVSYMNSYPWRA